MKLQMKMAMKKMVTMEKMKMMKIEESDYDEDSEYEDLEETEEGFLERYAKVADEVEGDLVEEGDSENETYTIDLGSLLLSWMKSNIFVGFHSKLVDLFDKFGYER